jgi:hypothetical protein
MSRLTGVGLGVFASVWLALFGGVAEAVPAQAAPGSPEAGACAPGEGVTVVVDAGGAAALEVRCAPGAPDSGLAATEAAGFSYEFVPKQIGFVCQIDGWPDPCNGAPADAYWSLWTGEDGEWAYATVGAASLRPPVDGMMAWAFGTGEPPSVAVPDVSAEAPDSPTSGPSSPPPSGAEPTPNALDDALTGPGATAFAALLVVVAGVVSFLTARGRRRRG